MKMPFGKHRGEEIEDLPSSYLFWLAENSRDEEVAKAADEEWKWREDHGEHKED